MRARGTRGAALAAKAPREPTARDGGGGGGGVGSGGGPTTAGAPRWAKIRKRCHDADDVSTVRSERFVRADAALRWKGELERAEARAWDDALDSALADGAGEGAGAGDDETSEEGKHFAQQTSSRSFPFELLPVTCVVPPTACLRDRRALAGALLRRAASRPSFEECDEVAGPVAALRLPRFAPTLRATLAVLLDQIARLEGIVGSGGGGGGGRWRRQLLHGGAGGKRSASMQEIILSWAGRTSSYSSVTIIVEDPGGFREAKVRESFLAAAREWRSARGLPVSVVAIVSVSGAAAGTGADEGDPSRALDGSGDCGMRVRQVRVGADDWISSFWGRMIAPRPSSRGEADERRADLPVAPVTSGVFRRMQRDCDLDYGSLSRLVRDALADSVGAFFAEPGSFVWDLAAPSSWNRPQFAAWCCTYSTAREVLSSNSAPPAGKSRSGKLRALEDCHRIQRRYIGWHRLRAQSLRLRAKGGRERIAYRGDGDAAGAERCLFILADMHRTLVSLLDAADSARKERDEKSSTDRSFAILRRYLDRGRDTSHQKDAADGAGGYSVRSRRSASTTAAAVPPASDGHEILNALRLVNELIVLLGRSSVPEHRVDAKVTPSDSAMVTTGVDQMMDRFDALAGTEMDECMAEWKDANPLYEGYSFSRRGRRRQENRRTRGRDDGQEDEYFDDDEEEEEEEENFDPAAAPPICLRQEIVEGLSHPARAMYALLSNRLSITRDEWFYAFGGDAEQFSIGVCTLSACGLIQVKWGRGGKLLYEKVGVVWC